MKSRMRLSFAASLLVLALPDVSIAQQAEAATQGQALLDQRIIDTAAKIQPKVVAWRRDIHQHPELSDQEVRTAKLVADHLKSLGIEVRTGVAHHGVIGILKGGKPGGVVALRADMDALPVKEETGLPFASKVQATYDGKKTFVAHACGHDAHTAILMGAAEILASVKSDLPGTVVFVFQPAEEGTPGDSITGAQLMVEEKALDNPRPDAMFGLHVQPDPAGQLSWRAGPLTASSDRIEIRLTGKQTHGAQPWEGVDIIAMTADIVQAFNRIAAREHDVTRSPAILTISALNGGNRYNIIPDSMTMLGTLRTFEPEVRTKIMSRAEAAVSNIASEYGASGKIIWTAPTPSIANDPKLVTQMTATLRQAAAGKIDDSIGYITGSEDFAFFSQYIPTFYYFLGIGFPKGTNHSPLFDVTDEAAMEVGVRAQALTALHFLQQRAAAH